MERLLIHKNVHKNFSFPAPPPSLSLSLSPVAPKSPGLLFPAHSWSRLAAGEMREAHLKAEKAGGYSFLRNQGGNLRGAQGEHVTRRRVQI